MSNPITPIKKPLIITVAGNKGGVGKTTTAVHLAAYFAAKGPTLLIDGDPNRSAIDWASQGGLPFKCVPDAQAAMYAKDADYIVIDTEARPDDEELKTLVGGCHLLVLPATPDRLSLRVLLSTVDRLRAMGAKSYRVLLVGTKPRSRAVGDAREVLAMKEAPVFESEIPHLTVYERAVDFGVSVAEVKDPRAARAWEAYESVGKEILP